VPKGLSILINFQIENMNQLIFISLFLISATAFSQNINGIVKDTQDKLLSPASVMLQRTKDSAVVKIETTNSSGKYQFNSIESGNYFVSVSYIGYAVKRSPAFEVKEGPGIRVPDMILEKVTTSLQDVTVTSKKPIVEVKADKMVLNVEGTINAIGTDVLELLRKSPGVTVDRDDNLSLAGKTGVQIYIDGHPSPLTGKDLSDYLKSLSSTMIEAIEIITNPSAKYDAAGTGGIINIRLKKNKAVGTNGSLNAGYNIGVYSKYNGGFSMNHRGVNTNLFGNYNYTQSINANFMNLRREVLDTAFDQRLDMLNKGHAQNFKAGMDYFINKKNTVGIIISGNASKNNISGYSRTPISYIPTGEIDRILVADNNAAAKRQNLNFNMNYRYTDTSGRELNVDADYGNYRLRNNQMQPNYYYDSTGKTEIYRVINNMISPTDINIYSFKADYEQPFKKGRLSFGGKTSFVNTTNKFERYDVSGNNKILDLSRSNFFEYKENIYALYMNYNRQLKGILIQAGLRVENTASEGNSYPLGANGNVDKNSKQPFKRNYTDFFPSGALTFNKNPLSQLNFTFSRRIDRPAYQDLNPFEFKLDEYSFLKGNTGLRPQYTNSIGVTHTYKYKLNTSLNYSHVKDVLAQLVDTTEKSKSFLTKKNLATQNIVSFNINYPLTIKWYTAFANLNAYYSHYKADFGPGRTINLDVYVFNIYMQHSVNFGKGWKGEISGWYVSPSIWQGFSRSGKMWSMDAGLQKLVFNGAGNFKISVSDVFQSMRWKGTSNFAGQHSVATGGWESRLLKLNFAWHFGNTQMKESRQRKAGAEDENKRVKENNDNMGRQ
jgi:hypothetical protein